jgi:hypothetical protein
MLFNTKYIAIAASLSILSNALPFDTPRQLAPRQKNYSVINVDGGSSEAAQATTVIRSTTTVEVVNPGPTITQAVTTTVVTSESKSSATPSVTSTSAISTSSSTKSIPVETPKPIFVTVTVPQDDGPTEYYDNGLWHTYYRIKTFSPAVATFTSSPLSSIAVPALETSTPSSYKTNA